MVKNIVDGTFEKYEQLTFQELMSGHSEHHARTSASQDSEEEWTEIVRALSERFSGSSKNRSINPNGLSMKMLRGCLAAIEDGTFSEFSLKWTDWGTTSNGKFSTARIGVFHKTGKGSTLSDTDEMFQRTIFSL